MSLGKEISGLLDNQRQILKLRREACKVNRESYALWAMRYRRAGFEDSAAMMEETFIGYFEQEEISLEFLEGVLDRAQQTIVATISKLEAEVDAKRKNG